MSRSTAHRETGRRLALHAVLLVLALGLAALLLLPRLNQSSGPAEGSTEVRFVREMIQHHAQAVDLSTRIRERGKNPAVRTLALDIMLSQQEQIGQMHGWLTLWNRPWGGAGMTTEHALGMGMGMATPQQVASLDTLPPAQAEVTFLQLMTRHHQGALMMAEPALGAGVRPEVQALARQIEASQSAEIRSMTEMLKERGAEPLPAPQMDMTHH
ncbi:DUF305 domain-containing protein [Deinococcus marmoris]|uniref:Secreted protein n=1 Tax=Deinococcus marmoris TaxID=249408 RepID=A0A1U7NXK2_9DEIO|nr:DUF305 domain-containing protein [Deinococcus marmoris]OLV17653.1 secreted protein [Deinococcus marmoris]